MALRIGSTLGLTQYGPDQLLFIQYRPVLDNRLLKEEFGYKPKKTSLEVFEYYLNAKDIKVKNRNKIEIMYP